MSLVKVSREVLMRRKTKSDDAAFGKVLELEEGRVGNVCNMCCLRQAEDGRFSGSISYLREQILPL